MGPELGSLYHELEEEVDWLQQKWNEFRELFAKGTEQIELLNTVAPNFFYMLHKLMFEDAMLHLCRLTDSAQTKVRVGKRVETRHNLSVMALAALISDDALKDRVIAQAIQVKKNCEFAREPRNRRLAHADLESFRNGTDGPKTLSKQVDDALKSMHEVLGSIRQYYGYPPSALMKDPFGAQSLLYYLKSAVRVETAARRDPRIIAIPNGRE